MYPQNVLKIQIAQEHYSAITILESVITAQLPNNVMKCIHANLKESACKMSAKQTMNATTSLFTAMLITDLVNAVESPAQKTPSVLRPIFVTWILVTHAT